MSRKQLNHEFRKWRTFFRMYALGCFVLMLGLVGQIETSVNPDMAASVTALVVALTGFGIGVRLSRFAPRKNICK